MKKSVIKLALACLVSVAVWAGNAHAQSSDAAAPPVKAKSKKTKKKKTTAAAGRGGTVKFLPGSQETVSQRSTRLKRECKGQVNAGACEGYTR